jgi:glyoxylase-like metal-dependent hydrolase (beta-lactamase superfamily II)
MSNPSQPMQLRTSGPPGKPALLGLMAGVLLAQAGTAARAQFGGGTDYYSAVAAERISEGLYTFRWGAYRSMFMVTEAGVIITDPISAKAAKAYRETIRSVTDQPVRFVVYSHSHWDRAAGARIFKAEGAQIVAQENCARDFERSPHPDVLMPDITFADRHTIALGGRSLELFYFGPSVSNCLIVMHVRGGHTIFMGTLATPYSGWAQPYDPTLANHHIYNLVPYLKQVEDLVERESIETLIGGFIALGVDEAGKKKLMPPAGPVSAVTEARRFWETLLAAVKVQSDKGVWSELIPEKIDLAPFETLKYYREDQFKYTVWRVAEYFYTGR